MSPSPQVLRRILEDLCGGMSGDNFVFSAKWGFFTWSQLGETTLDEFNTAFKQTFDQHGSTFEYVLGRERHEDGNVHFHALVEYTVKRKIRGLHRFRVLGRTPNCRPVTSAENAVNYCTKDGEIVASSQDWLASCQCGTHGPRVRKRKFNELIQDAKSKQDVLSTFKTYAPRDYYLHYDKLDSNLDKIFKPPETEYVSQFSLNDFPNANEDILHWYAHEVMGPHPKVRFAPLCVLRTREGSR